jgi:hypothetical protein
VICFNVSTIIEREIHYANITMAMLRDVTELPGVVTKMGRAGKQFDQVGIAGSIVRG